jgi:signal recognition particle subunit SRP54
LGGRLLSIFSGMRGRGVLGQDDVNTALRQVRMALLEADVALPAVKSLTEQLQTDAVGAKVATSLRPDQVMTKIVHDRLVDMLAHPKPGLEKSPCGLTTWMLVGLQGSGKTTMASKLAWWSSTQTGTLKAKRILMASADIYRPAALLQLEQLANQLKEKALAVDSLPIMQDEPPATTAKRAQAYSQQNGYDLLIFDTAGRLQLDSAMMDEAQALASILKPTELILVIDSLTGQNAVPLATGFAEHLPLTGLALSRIDADHRGGAALSVRFATSLPIKAMGTGERPQDFELFDGHRIAGRILDQGDVVSLVEKVQNELPKEAMQGMMARFSRGIFTLDDLAKQIDQIGKMGGLSSLLGLMPGIRQLKEMMPGQIDQGAKKMGHQKAILSSMTARERRMPALLDASRKQRIAKGSGTTPAQVNQLLKGFEQMQKMVKTLAGSTASQSTAGPTASQSTPAKLLPNHPSALGRKAPTRPRGKRPKKRH